MIINGRSSIMRLVSRTHRCALDRLFDRINLDPKIQIKYVDTRNQLADLLTKGSFTRDEWDHFHRLLNVMNFSMFSCSHFLPNRKKSVMSKRAQKSTSKESSAVAIPRPRNLVSKNLVSAKNDPPQDSSDPKSLGIKNWIRVTFHPAAGNWRQTSTKTQQRILKSSNKMTLHHPAPGNWSAEMNLQAQPAPGNWSEVRTSKSGRTRLEFHTSRSPTIDTLRKSSRTCGRSCWISQKRHQ